MIIKKMMQKSRKHKDSISIETKYKEMNEEMRRTRDYELDVSNWNTIILLAIIAGIITLKTNRHTNELLNFCLDLRIPLVKIFISICIFLIILSASFSIYYCSKRNEHMRKWVDKNLEKKINGIKEYKPKESFLDDMEQIVDPPKDWLRPHIWLTITFIFLGFTGFTILWFI